jgi:hypothetical protein
MKMLKEMVREGCVAVASVVVGIFIIGAGLLGLWRD